MDKNVDFSQNLLIFIKILVLSCIFDQIPLTKIAFPIDNKCGFYLFLLKREEQLENFLLFKTIFKILVIRVAKLNKN